MRKKSRGPKKRKSSRAEELVDFLQDVALGKRKATEREVEQAAQELNEYLPDAEDDETRSH